MSYQTITFDEEVLSGDKLQFIGSFFDMLYIYKPDESELEASANQAPGFSISKVSYPLASANVTGFNVHIEGNVTETITPQEIADGIKNAWLTDFKTIRNVTIDEVDKDKFSITPSPSTTISLVAIAVVAIVILVLAFKFT